MGNFHDPDDFEKDDEEKGDSWKPENIYGNELFKKSIEILNLTETICSMLPEDNRESEFTSQLMMENATIVPGKIKGGLTMEEQLMFGID